MKLLPFALLLLLLQACANGDQRHTVKATAVLKTLDSIREDFIIHDEWNQEWKKVLKELDEPVDLSKAKYEVFRYTHLLHLLDPYLFLG